GDDRPIDDPHLRPLREELVRVALDARRRPDSKPVRCRDRGPEPGIGLVGDDLCDREPRATRESSGRVRRRRGWRAGQRMALLGGRVVERADEIDDGPGGEPLLRGLAPRLDGEQRATAGVLRTGVDLTRQPTELRQPTRPVDRAARIRGALVGLVSATDVRVEPDLSIAEARDSLRWRKRDDVADGDGVCRTDVRSGIDPRRSVVVAAGYPTRGQYRVG